VNAIIRTMAGSKLAEAIAPLVDGLVAAVARAALEERLATSHGEMTLGALADRLLELPTPRRGSVLLVFEREVLERALKKAGSVSAAARLVGLPRKVFQRRIERLRRRA
jgi:DNA-binding NtrC family response regulator